MSELTFRRDRLEALMGKRRLNDGQLAYKADISKSMVFYLRTGGRDNVSAVVAGRLAQVLGCSVDYLVGITDEPTPYRMDISETVDALLQSARHLPRHRQRDLIRMAETFANENAQDQMDTVLSMVRDIGGEQAETLLIELLASLRPDDDLLLGTDEDS